MQGAAAPVLCLAAGFESCHELSGPPATALMPCQGESCMYLAMQGCGADDGQVAAGEEGHVWGKPDL